MKNYKVAQGRGLQYMDMKDNKQVCVIGDYLNRAAFGGNGLARPSRWAPTSSASWACWNAKVTDRTCSRAATTTAFILPYTTAMRLSSQSQCQELCAVMEDESRANEAKAVVESGLYDLLKSDNATTSTAPASGWRR